MAVLPFAKEPLVTEMVYSHMSFVVTLTSTASQPGPTITTGGALGSSTTNVSTNRSSVVVEAGIISVLVIR